MLSDRSLAQLKDEVIAKNIDKFSVNTTPTCSTIGEYTITVQGHPETPLISGKYYLDDSKVGTKILPWRVVVEHPKGLCGAYKSGGKNPRSQLVYEIVNIFLNKIREDNLDE